MSDYPILSTCRFGSTSQVSLHGATNLGQFTCLYCQQFPPMSLTIVNRNPENGAIIFKNTCLMLDVAKLDCGNHLMNQDLQKALDVLRHPFIIIELQQLMEVPGKEKGKISALINLTISGVGREKWVEATIKKIADGHFRVVGNKALTMREFGIEPPVAFLGLVKTKDDLVIHFDTEIIL